MLLVYVFLFTGCQFSQQKEETIKLIPLEEIKVAPEDKVLPKKITESNIFQSKKLGIKFSCFSDDCIEKLTVEDNKIFNKAYYIKVFNKAKEISVEATILNIIQEDAKDISKCKVVKKGQFWGNKNYDVYVLELVNPDIEYTKEELAEIKIADQETIKNGGPFNGEWQKRVIYNRRLVKACSYYAEPLGLGTSTSTPSRFIYNKKSKIVFLPGVADQPFYKEDSIELID